MIIQETYLKNKSGLLFSNDKNTIKNREKILNKFNEEYFNKKYNESIKNLDMNIFNNFNYFYENKKNLSSIRDSEKRIYNINIVNGVIEEYEDEKIKISKIKIQNNSTNYLSKNDFVLDLNALFTNSGYELIIKKKNKMILNISNSFTDEKYTIFQKNLIKCEEGAELTLIENFENDKSLITNIVCTLDILNNSKIEHIVTQRNKKNNNLFFTTFAKCDENSKYNQSIFNFSDGFVRNHHHADLNEKNSIANYNGVFFLKNSNFSENKTYVRHKTESCKSDQNYKGILNDSSKGVYNSFTIVDQDAQKTEGYQLSKGILLSEESSFFSKPELRIYADDVKCSHGSTIGPIDEQIIFYIRSRGINKREAINILVKSFIQESISKINNYIVEKKLESYVNEYLLH